MIITLGGLIKELRQQKRLSQFEVAASLGWKEESRLSRIEQGKIENPPREFIEKLAIAMDLDEIERNTLLLAGNHLPNETEIIQIRNALNSLVEEWIYPATVYDFACRVIHENGICKTIYYSSDEEAEKIAAEIPNIFELNFSPKYSQNKLMDKDDIQKFRREKQAAIIQYQLENKHRTNQSDYKKMIKRMINNKEFREMWEQGKSTIREDVVGNYTYSEMVIPARDPDKKLCFHLFNVPLLKDPRINIEYHMPANLETHYYFMKHLYERRMREKN